MSLFALFIAEGFYELPIESGLGWTVKFDKGNFLGRDAIAKILENGPKRKLVGFQMADKGIPRQGYRLLHSGSPIGEVTSGTLSPTLGVAIGIGYVEKSHSSMGSELDVEIRNRFAKAKIVKTPFVKSRGE